MKTFFALLGGLLLSSLVQATGDLTPLPDKPVAHDFSLRDMDGKLHRLSDYRGKPVIVNFWATWCPPCRRELPSMNRAWSRVKQQGIVMLAINVGEDEDTIFPFMADYPIDFPVLLDMDGETIKRWPVKGLPTTFVIDPRGRIVYQAVGGREWDDKKLLDKVRELKVFR
jgi:peroxiredoxin